MSKPYEVGHGKPPVSTRFQKGQSGNPGGRRKGSKNLSTMLQDALNEKVTVNVNGRRRKISKLEAGFIQAANKAAGGDQKTLKLMVEMLSMAEVRDDARSGGEETSPETTRAQNLRILGALKMRLQAEAGKQDDG